MMLSSSSTKLSILFIQWFIIIHLIWLLMLVFSLSNLSPQLCRHFARMRRKIITKLRRWFEYLSAALGWLWRCHSSQAGFFVPCASFGLCSGRSIHGNREDPTLANMFNNHVQLSLELCLHHLDDKLHAVWQWMPMPQRERKRRCWWSNTLVNYCKCDALIATQSGGEMCKLCRRMFGRLCAPIVS